MIVKVGNFEFTEVWDGVLYKKLSNYPNISDWEIRTLIEFADYEEKFGRECVIECDDKDLLNKISEGMKNKSTYSLTTRPSLITECTACPQRKGCETEYVCHTTSVENAVKIFECGKLLSSIKARGVPVQQLMSESRNAANDPADYFEYIMFSWGNCQAGDRLVMERSLGRFPNDEDLSVYFKPGIRLYFRYDELTKHPKRIFDGVLPMKIKDELTLSDWVYKIIIPSDEKSKVECYISDDLRERVIYVDNDCVDIWEWSEKVYNIIKTA